MVGQRTPGVSTEQAIGFERRINQRYVDFNAQIGLDYLGVYTVEGLVPGAFGELLMMEAPSVAELLRRDAELGAPPDIDAINQECRELFWQRGSIRLWFHSPDGWRRPGRGESLRVELLDSLQPGAFAAEPWSGEGEPQVPAVRVEVLGPDLVVPENDVIADSAPRVPERPELPLTLTFRPWIPSPEPAAAIRP